MLIAGKADMWDSGRVESPETRDIKYAGPELQPSKRYFWRVLAWDADKKQYPASDATWWETGLLHQSAWKSKWIGYEEPELRSVRESGAQWITNPEVADYNPTTAPRHDFRLRVDLAKPNSTRHALRRWARHRLRMGEREASARSAAASSLEADALENVRLA